MSRVKGAALAGGLALPLVVVALAAILVVTPTSSSEQLAPGTVPAAYASLIQSWGHSCPSLTPARLAAQLYAESGFNPKATSPVGAQGIAQFMPGTWAGHGIDANGDGTADVWDPADAIPSAALYDCSLAADVRSIGGDTAATMLAAYNAGPYAVLQARGVPPYAETQGYVARITQLEQTFAATTAAPPPSRAGAAAVAFAYNVLGTPYEWGGTGADGRFDCSGLTSAAYAAAGVHLPRTAAEQWYAGKHVSLSALQPGDLVFYAFNLADPSTIHHVGIYVGNGYMIDAPHTGADIRFDSIWEPDLIGASRLA